MQTISKVLAKGAIATAAAGAMVLTSTPTMARDHRDHDDGIDAGDIIAGALIIGGIAAVASAAGRDRYDGYGRYDRYDRYYDRAGSPRSAVERCVYAAERNASRYSWRGNAKVTDIRDIDRRRDGYTIRGRIAVNTMGRDWRRGDVRYGRGWDNDYRGWDSRYSGYDSGRFTCRIRYGRVVDIDYSGIRGL